MLLCVFVRTYSCNMSPHVLYPPIPSLHTAGKHTASTHHLSALETPAGRSYVCEAKQPLTLISSDHQKGVTVAISDVQIQPFDINSDFMFSEGTDSNPNVIQPCSVMIQIEQQPTIVLPSFSKCFTHLKCISQYQKVCHLEERSDTSDDDGDDGLP